MAEGEELPPVVIPLEGRDQEFLDMLVRDEEALAAFAERMNVILGDVDLTFSGGQIRSEGIGAAGEAIGEELSLGISEGAGGLDLGAEMLRGLDGAAQVGERAGAELSAGLEESFAAVSGPLADDLALAGATAGHSLTEALATSTASTGDTLGHHIGDQLRVSLEAAGSAGVLAASAAGAGLFAGLPAAAGHAATLAVSALGDGLIEGVAGVGDRLAGQIGGDLRGAFAGPAEAAAVQLADALLEGTAGTGDILGSQIGLELRSAAATAGEDAGALLKDALLEGASGIGDALGVQLSGEVSAASVGGTAASIQAAMEPFAETAERAGQDAGVRYVAGLQSGISTAGAAWGPQFGLEEGPKADPFVQDPDRAAHQVRASVLAAEQAAKEAAAQEAQAVADSMHNALIGAFGSSNWQISGEQFAQLTDAGVAAWREELDAQAAAVGAGFSQDFAAALRAGLSEVDWTALTEAQAAGLTDALEAFGGSAGRSAAAGVGNGLVSGIEETLAADQSFLQAAMDAGMSRPLMEAVQDMRAGIEVDLEAIPNELMGAFEGISERFAEQGAAAGTAYALSLQESLNALQSTMRPATEAPVQTQYVDPAANLEKWAALQDRVSSGSDGAAAGFGKMGAAAAGAEASVSGLAGMMTGPLGYALMSVPMMFGPQIIGWLDQLAGTGDHTAVSVTGLETSLLNLGQSSGALPSQITDLAAAMGTMSNLNHDKSVKGMQDIDTALSNLYQTNPELAVSDFDQMSAAMEKQGISAQSVAQYLPNYTAAVQNASIAAKAQQEALAGLVPGTEAWSDAVAKDTLTLEMNAAQAAASAAAQNQYLQSLMPGTAAYTQAVHTQQSAILQSADQAALAAMAQLNLGSASNLVQEAIYGDVDAYQRATGAASAYNTVLSSLNGTQAGLDQAQNTLAQDMLNAKSSFAQNSYSLDLNTQAGINNRQSLVSASQAILAMGVAQYQASGNLNQANQVIQQQINAYVKATGATGQAKTAIEQYLEQLTKIPPDVSTTVTANTAPAFGKLNDFLKTVDTSSGYVTIYGQTDSAGSSQLGHGQYAFADGGFIPGSPGQPVPILAHGGEYVLSADMQAGRQTIDPRAMPAAGGYLTPGADAGLAALAGAYSAGSAAAPVVNVSVYLDGQLVSSGVRHSTQYYKSRNSITGF